MERKTPHGTFWRAHRFAWYEANGPIPDGLLVLHKCDNPPCINVEHLFLGTHADNVADMVAKGRSTKGKLTTLTTKDVYEIRTKRSNGTLLTQLAKDYGVSSMQISRIARHKQWKHIQ